MTEGFFASGTRQDDGSVITGGQTDQIDLTVNPSEDSAFRDVVPAEWTVLAEYSDDVARVEEAGDVQYVYFDAEATADAETGVTYFVEAPDDYAESGEYVFGPAQVDPESRDGWVDVAGTSDTNVVAGQST